MNIDIENMSFACNVKIVASSLEICYTFVNNADSDAGIFNVIPTPKPDGTSSFNPENAYIDLENSILHIRKTALAVPEGLQVAERIVPLVTVLHKGESFTEKFSIDLPIEVCNPYRRGLLGVLCPDGEVVPIAKKTTRRIQVSIGMFKLTPDIKLHEVVCGNADIYRVWPPGVCVERQAIFSKSFELEKPLQVLDYECVDMGEVK